MNKLEHKFNYRVWISELLHFLQLNYICKWFIISDGQILPLTRRQRVYSNGTLVIEQTQRLEDAGTYTCQATNRQKTSARRDLEVQVIGMC